MGEKKIWKEDPLEKTGAKTHKKKNPQKIKLTEGRPTRPAFQ
jgi:hypothetical protein